jgi:hypothetical protein
MTDTLQHDQRDRYSEASDDMMTHIGEKILMVLRHPDNQARLQSVMDPVISHIIQRVFPYILLSAILFLILFILTIGTFWVVVRGSSAVSSAVKSVAISSALLSSTGV